MGHTNAGGCGAQAWREHVAQFRQSSVAMCGFHSLIAATAAATGEAHHGADGIAWAWCP